MISFSTSPAVIKIGTEFAIKVDSITDSSGNPVDPTTFQFDYRFFCGNSKYYRVTNNIHSVIENDILYFVFSAYPFAAGFLQYIESFTIGNAMFPDGKQTILNQYKTTIQFC